MASQPATAPDLSKPLVVDRGAFRMADPDLRTDLRVAFGDGVYRFALGDAEAMQIEWRYVLGKVSLHGLVHEYRRSHVPIGPAKGIGAVYADLCRGRALFGSGEPIWAGLGTADPSDAAFYRTDIALVIGWGLIGGGEGIVDGKRFEVDERKAAELVARYVTDAPLAPNWTLAFAILGTRLFGREPDPEMDG
jgi:hypothetical protein